MKKFSLIIDRIYVFLMKYVVDLLILLVFAGCLFSSESFYLPFLIFLCFASLTYELLELRKSSGMKSVDDK